jgi:hypothetical protein
MFSYIENTKNKIRALEYFFVFELDMDFGVVFCIFGDYGLIK